MSRGETDLKARTKSFSVLIVKLYSGLPKNTEAQVIGKQFLRSGTSVGAHYREAARSRSDAEFVSKIEVALQELDETIYWLELLEECLIVNPEKLLPIKNEANELTSIFVSCVKKVKARLK